MSDSDEDSDRPKKLIKTAYDYQRMKLEKLMKNPAKPVQIPERPKDKKNSFVPDFVRNVMGSSAGAGSGEFHVYRHLRRKEYARQKAISEMSEKERLDYEFQEKLLENQRKAEERTAKKRAKRLRKKAKKPKQKKPKNTNESNDTDSGTPLYSSDNEEKSNLVDENTKTNSEKVSS